MTERKIRKQNSVFVSILILISIVTIILIIAWMIVNRNETRISSGEKEQVVSYLDCTSSSPKDPFFVSPGAIEVKHELKVIFEEDKLDEISYVYEGVFNLEEEVESAYNTLLANYNIYMGEHNVDPGTINPVFSNLKNKLKISLYTDRQKINITTANLFFLTADERNMISRYSARELGEIYKEKGFSCIFRE